MLNARRKHPPSACLCQLRTSSGSWDRLLLVAELFNLCVWGPPDGCGLWAVSRRAGTGIRRLSETKKVAIRKAEGWKLPRLVKIFVKTSANLYQQGKQKHEISLYGFWWLPVASDEYYSMSLWSLVDAILLKKSPYTRNLLLSKPLSLYTAYNCKHVLDVDI